jgi:hypothetical protein
VFQAHRVLQVLQALPVLQALRALLPGLLGPVLLEPAEEAVAQQLLSLSFRNLPALLRKRTR